MDGYQVNVGELNRTENLIREFGAALDTTTDHTAPIVPDAVGNAELAGALAEFDRHSRHATQSLSADAAAAAERLADTAARYQRHDQTLTDLITGLAG